MDRGLILGRYKTSSEYLIIHTVDKAIVIVIASYHVIFLRGS